MSAKQFVISDLHFHHKNMAIRRTFKNADEMNEHIIEKWNSVVNKKDTVFILGDITMEKSNYEILNRLNGFKKVILGNHEKPQHVKELLKFVNSVCSSFQMKGYILTHIPIHSSEFKRFKGNIHGHLHEKNIKRFLFFKDKRYINVGCEQINYTPIELKPLLK